MMTPFLMLRLRRHGESNPTFRRYYQQNIKPLLTTSYSRLPRTANSLLQNKSNTLFIYSKIVKPLLRYYFKGSIAINIYNKETLLHKVLKYNRQNFQFVQQVWKDKKYNIYFSYSGTNRSEEYPVRSWFSIFNGKRRALRMLNTPWDMLEEYCHWCGIPAVEFSFLLWFDIGQVYPFFDLLKRRIHENINYLPPEFRYYLDITNIVGYPKMKDRLLSSDPVAWLTTVETQCYSVEWWQDQLLKTFSESVVTEPINLPTLQEFCNMPWLWATAGASHLSRLVLDGEIVKTKTGVALSRDGEFIYNQAIKQKDPGLDKDTVMSVFPKGDEKNEKLRYIVNMPFGIYVVCALMLYKIKAFVGDNPLFMQFDPTTSEYVDIVNFLRQGYTLFPLDESAYDYHVTRESWLGFIEFYKSIFGNSEEIEIFNSYFKQAQWKLGSTVGKWNSGMPSGLTLTAFLNSWFNYVKQRTILPGQLNWAAGDDVLACPYEQNLELEYISKEYEKFASVAHPQKNWKSNRYAEYLRHIISANGITGYPARIFSSLLWATDEPFYLPSDKLPELAELFKQFFDRLGLPLDEDYVARDLVRSVANKVEGFNITKAKQWLHAPRIHGGFGLYPYNDKTFTWTVESKRTLRYENARIRTPRILKYYGKVYLDIGTYKYQSNVTTRLGGKYPMPEITTMADWEARINREDITYSGPFSNLVMDVIPLPTLNFVSTQAMSRIANENLFNCWPNLTGSRNSISSRLIKLSYQLLDLVDQYMIDNDLEILL